jgi:hypothetical protein
MSSEGRNFPRKAGHSPFRFAMRFDPFILKEVGGSVRDSRMKKKIRRHSERQRLDLAESTLSFEIALYLKGGGRACS